MNDYEDFDDAENFELNELAQDHENQDDFHSDAFEDWRDDCNGQDIQIEDSDIYGDPECW